MQIPRIGQEVIVSFLEGDPDRPIITGRVYNAEQTVPYELPANATQSGTKSRSSKGGTPANFNEIRMEDKKGAEQLSPFSFDVSVWEFFWPLMSGARLVVAAPGDHRDPAKLVALINREGVDTLHFVPSMLQAFLQDEDVASCTSLKRIVCRTRDPRRDRPVF